MRILYIHQHFRRPDEPGGSRPYEMATRLAARGHDVTVVCAGESTRSYSVDGIRVRQVRATYTNKMSFARRMVAFGVFAARSTLTAVRTKSDLVFASSTPLTVAVPALAAKRWQRIPMVFEVRDLWPEVPIKLGHLRNPALIRIARVLERTAYHHSEVIVGLSPTMVRGIERVRPEADVRLLPNTAQPVRFRQDSEKGEEVRRSLGIGPQETLLIYAGSHGVSYNISWLLEIAALTRSAGVRVVVLGQGAQTDALTQRCIALGLDPATVMKGQVSKNEVVSYYQAADAVVSCLIDDPSLEDNSLNKVFDAFAAGRPLLFNHGGWLTQVATEAGAGWQLHTDPEQAADQLLALVARKPWDDLRSASAALATEDFNVDHVAHQLESALSDAVSQWANKRHGTAEPTVNS